MVAAFALDGHNYHPDRLWRRAHSHIHASPLRYRGKHTRSGLIAYSATHSNPGSPYPGINTDSHAYSDPDPDYPWSNADACSRRHWYTHAGS